MLCLIAGTGLRRGEALALRWADVDLDAGVLAVRGTLNRVNGSLVDHSAQDGALPTNGAPSPPP